jgi:hypothetical protein
MKRNLTSKTKGLKRKPVKLMDGPFAHCVAMLFDRENTLTFTVKGETGRYVNGWWQRV